MNKRNFNRLISRIKKLEMYRDTQLPGYSENYFCMSRYRYDCGAPACMAGHGGALFKTEPHQTIRDTEVTADALDIDLSWAYEHLFNPSFCLMKTRNAVTQKNPICLGNITPAEAVIALTRVKAAGNRYKDLTLDDIWGGLRD